MTRSEAAAATVLAGPAAVEKAHQQHSTPSNAKSPNPICVFHVHVRVNVIVLLNILILWIPPVAASIKYVIRLLVMSTPRSVCP
jgi:hypothetical protein